MSSKAAAASKKKNGEVRKSVQSPNLVVVVSRRINWTNFRAAG